MGGREEMKEGGNEGGVEGNVLEGVIEERRNVSGKGEREMRKQEWR